MAKMVINFEGDKATIDLKKFRGEVDKTDKSIKKVDKSSKGMTSSLLKIGAATAGIYAVGRAFTALVSSSFKYNIQMDASESKLRAMISASRSWTTVSGKQITAMERMALVNNEVNSTMELLKKANAETAMGMSELIDVFALMKPAMDRVNVSTKDQVGILKLVTNAASNFGLSAQELATGIDDLATGTWLSTSGFGKMAKALGITKDEVKGTTDLVGYLNEKLKDVGQSQDNWATAVSNFGVAWDDMTGKITKPIFEPIKMAIKDLTTLMGEVGVEATKAFSTALKEFAKAGIAAIGFVIKAVSQLVHALMLAAKGYEKLSSLAGIAATKTGGFFDESRKWFKDLGASEKEQIRNARVLSEETAKRNKILSSQISEYNKIDDEVQGIIKSNNTLNGAVDTATGTFKKYISEWKETVSTVGEGLSMKGSGSTDGGGGSSAESAGKKIGKSLGKGIKDGVADAKISESVDAEMKRIAELSDGLANIIGNGFSSVFDNLIDGTESWGETFNRIAKDIMAQLFQILAIKPLVSSLSGAFSGVLGGSAIGYFATGGIVNSPTMFSNGGKPAVMGESGSEAIMPVSRMPSGNLGVEAVAPNVNVNVQNYGNDNVEVKQDESGQIDIIISKVVDSINRSGVVGQSIQSRYGLRNV